MNRVLLLGEEERLQALALRLREFGVQATTTRSEEGARAALAGPEVYDALVAELSAFARGAGLADKDLRRIAIVPSSSIDEACSALGREIDDCLVEPVCAEDLLLALQRPRWPRRVEALAEEPIIGKDMGLAPAWAVASKAAGFDTDVLITGESGTGKELFARALHRMSKRAHGPFVAVNCASIPAGLLESQLFGHVKGAFTDAHKDKQGVFAKANGGTLFLDEVGDFPLDLQVKLLRALQSGEIQPVGSETTIKVDLRLVSATSRDLEAMVAAKTFRDDLFYRLAVIPLALPPLRERREDLNPLIDHFLERFAAKHGLADIELAEGARKLLMQAPWPGNVRQLQNAVERLVVLSEGTQITEELALREIRQHVDPTSESATLAKVALRGRPLKEAMHAVEAQFIAEALAACSGKRARCAELLSISPRALLYKIKEHDL
jgi:two-component system response regulator AtoC